MSVELRLPNINAETNEGKIEQLQSFIYQLVQELNWYLNLEKATTSTTDDTEIKKLVNKVEDAEGNFSSISQSVDMIETKVSSVEGDVSTLQQTSTSLTTRVTNAEGDISTLTQTSAGLTSRVSSAEGDISSLQQTASSLSSRVSSAEGSASYAVQTANSVSSTVSQKVGNDEVISKINQSPESISISAGKVNLNGYVTFSGLKDGTTSIDGSSILVQNGDSKIKMYKAGNKAILYIGTKGNSDLTISNGYVSCATLDAYVIRYRYDVVGSMYMDFEPKEITVDGETFYVLASYGAET